MTVKCLENVISVLEETTTKASQKPGFIAYKKAMLFYKQQNLENNENL